MFGRSAACAKQPPPSRNPMIDRYTNRRIVPVIAVAPRNGVSTTESANPFVAVSVCDNVQSGRAGRQDLYLTLRAFFR